MSWQDIAALARQPDVHLVAPDLRPSDPALRGLFTRRGLRSGLGLHMSDAVDLHDLTTRAVGRPGITVTLFLTGRAAISLGDRAHEVGARPDVAGQPMPTAVIYSMTEPDVFERRGIRGEHLRKVGITIPPGWLGEAGLDAGAAGLAQRLERTHGALLAVPVSPDLARLAGVMLADLPGGAPCCGLMQEARAFELLARVFGLAATGGEAPTPKAPPRAEARLRAAQQYMAAHLEDEMTLAEVAAAACVSVSTLQRLFRERLGLPVWDYLRRLRLDQARRFLERGEGSVTEAAFRAGYTSPANFATAFKRAYGMPPSRCRR
ncbi:Transcriptional regulator, AraC family [Caenispirillum salinarum AK4]|uniref:Transcriptional regulator, AraC family n=1 Tax=Caenispirillum salinarum AK4 TaxID=1238182 RepID=K9GVW7_9PROT|nr:Transcriptional regulator, AraC family [Caenispirillum salinarum AK4]